MTATLCPTGRTLDQCIEQMTLMKAAPALLASAIVARDVIAADRQIAFDSYIRWLTCTGEGDGSERELIASYDKALASLDAAIAAAEGRA